MKHKRLIIIASAIVLAASSMAVYFYRHQLFPSEQMQSLRQLEQQLDLPKPDRRFEDDRGHSTDWKNVRSYNRHISLSYSDPAIFDLLRARLASDDWQEQPVNSYGSSTTWFKFVKGTGDAMFCVSGHVDNESTDGTPLYFQLQAAGVRGCNPAPGI